VFLMKLFLKVSTWVCQKDTVKRWALIDASLRDAKLNVRKDFSEPYRKSSQKSDDKCETLMKEILQKVAYHSPTLTLNISKFCRNIRTFGSYEDVKR